MSKKRNRLEIIRDILQAIKEKNEKIKPTHILYKSNLSHQLMEEYLGELISKKFITVNEEDKRKTYSLAPKGRKYLEEYKTIIAFSETFGLN